VGGLVGGCGLAWVGLLGVVGYVVGMVDGGGRHSVGTPGNDSMALYRSRGDSYTLMNCNFFSVLGKLMMYFASS
jgi:hypothetical protein